MGVRLGSVNVYRQVQSECHSPSWQVLPNVSFSPCNTSLDINDINYYILETFMRTPKNILYISPKKLCMYWTPLPF